MTKIQTGNRVIVSRKESKIVCTVREVIRVCSGVYTVRVEPDNGFAFCVDSRKCKVTYCY